MDILSEIQWPTSWFTIRDLARPHLERLRDVNSHFSYLTVLEGCKLVTIDVAPGSSSSYYVPPGLKSCGVYSAPGKVLLAYESDEVVRKAIDAATEDHGPKITWTIDNFPDHLLEVQKQGYGLDLEEHHRGLVCIALPIMDDNGKCIASIGQSVLIQNPDYNDIVESIIPVLIDCKALLEKNIRSDWSMPKEQDKNETLSNALNALMKNIGKNDLDMGQLAESLHISHRQLTRMFKDHLKTSPYQYLLGLRFEKACQLLSQSEHSIKEIASSCGFSSSNNFCTAFKKRYEATPDSYRTLNKS